MSKSYLSDSEAKGILRKWPECPTKLFRTAKARGYWLRAQPPDGKTTGPTLVSPGARLFKTQPDGLWLWFKQALKFVDVIAVEVCREDQNLRDKRSRYMPTGHALLVRCPHKWLMAEITRQNSGKKPRWKACGTLSSEPPDKGSEDIPVRHIRVLYALPDRSYNSWLSNVAAAPYEFYCRHSSLRSYTAEGYRGFLNKMIPQAQYYTLPKEP